MTQPFDSSKDLYFNKKTDAENPQRTPKVAKCCTVDRFTKRLLWNINGSQVVLMEEYLDKPCRIFFVAQMSLLPLVLALIFGVGLVPFGAIMRPGRSCIIWYW